jgi:hypothetical protein
MLVSRTQAFLTTLKKEIPPFEKMFGENPEPFLNNTFVEEKEIKSVTGGYSQATFWRWSGRLFSFGAEAKLSTSLDVAVLRPLNEVKPDSGAFKALETEKIMRARGIPEDFNQYNLYYDAKGNQVSPRALKDLYFFMKENGKFPLNQVKEFVVQVILAVYDHHSRGRIHFDIKPENFLVFFRNGRYQIKLADHRDSFDVNEAGIAVKTPAQIIVTEEFTFTSPELKAVYLSPTKEGINSLNFKASDCFALGQTIKEMCFFLLDQKWHQHPGLNNFINGLKQENPALRMTVRQALESPFLGATLEDRMNLIARVRAQAKASNLKIDGYDQMPVYLEDPFYLLDHRIKPIYRPATKIAEEIESCQQVIQSGCSRGEFSQIVNQFNRLKKHAHYFLKTSASHSDDKSSAAQLKKAVSEDVNEVLAALLKDKKALANLLKRSVDEAYRHYILINNLQPNSKAKKNCFKPAFFEIHGARGEGRALQFKQKVAAAYRKEPANPKAIFDLFYEHYHHEPGNTHAQSFKTIVYDKLRLLAPHTLEDWKVYFDRRVNLGAKTV